LIVPLVAMIAGVLLSPHLDKFSLPENIPVVPSASNDASKAASERDAPAETAAAATRADAGEGDVAVDLNGTWTVTNRIESATNAKFRGLALGFTLQLQQRGNRVTGTGAKMTENGKALAAGRRTPISVEGTLEGRQLALKFTERGAQRSSTGQLSWELTDEGTLRGTFTSEAASARGTSTAKRSR
jgi:hypothetical protein